MSRRVLPVLLTVLVSQGGRSRGAEAPVPPAAPRIEVAFVLDATGSMSGSISEARARIKDIAASLATGVPTPSVRFALVSFRDRGDQYVTRVDPFTADLDTMRGWLDRTEASGGGDTPEAVVLGLHAAVSELAWTDGDREVLKLVYLVGDAPDKGYGDAPTLADVTAHARRRGIVIHTLAVGASARADATFDRAARWTEGRALGLRDPARRAIAGRPGDASLEAAVSGTTRAYSASVGVDYASGVPVTTAALPAPAVAESGLRGAGVRWIRDPLAWGDLWAAHTSLLADGTRPPAPAVDFAKDQVLCVGGGDARLGLGGVTLADGAATARLLPGPGAGVTFVLIPRASVGGGK